MPRLLVGILCASFVFTAAIHEGVAAERPPANVANAATDTPVADDADVAARKDRITGAIMGVLIGDALGVGSHWYYDLDELKRDFGPWISDYSDPKADGTVRFTPVHKQRYDEGVRAGDPSQTGQLIIRLLESVVDKGTYDQGDFTSRLDELFSTLDGTSYSGRFTDEAVRKTWKHRKEGRGWDHPEVGSDAVTSEAAQMNVILAALYSGDATRLANESYRNTKLFYHNEFAITNSVSYALVVGGLINGVPLEQIEDHIGSVDRDMVSGFGLYPEVPVSTGAIALDPELAFPPHLVGKVYGLACDIQELLPAAYYLGHRYTDDFEDAVLTAINGGGNNMARSALTGAMSGAIVGLKGIPERFITGLGDHERLLALAKQVAELAVN